MRTFRFRPGRPGCLQTAVYDIVSIAPIRWYNRTENVVFWQRWIAWVLDGPQQLDAISPNRSAMRQPRKGAVRQRGLGRNVCRLANTICAFLLRFAIFSAGERCFRFRRESRCARPSVFSWWFLCAPTILGHTQF